MFFEIQSYPRQIAKGLPRLSRLGHAGAMLSSRQQTTLRMLTLAGMVLGALGWLYWLCARNPEVRFLVRHPPAEWILYPAPPDGSAHPIRGPHPELVTVFRRSFNVKQLTGPARLRVRALENFQITLNERTLGFRAPENWKEAAEFPLDGLLQAGENSLAITVTNRAGPPVLWLTVSVGGKVVLVTDSSWECSCAGAVWQPARLAASRRELRAGNALAGGERTAAVWREAWPLWSCFAFLVLASVEGAGHWRKDNAGMESKFANRAGILALVAIAVLWLALCLNNLRSLPVFAGFDSKQHLLYVQYILEEKALPLPDEGWEMHQPPLFYLLSAAGLGLLSLPANAAPGVNFIRLLTTGLGIAHLALVWASLRLLFPGQARAQIFGLVLAGFLPAHLVTSQYITNETTMALLVSGGLYLFLRIVHQQSERPLLYGALGVCLGAALLAKISAILAVPWIFLGLALELLRRKQRRVRVWLQTVGLAGLACLLVNGWHYLRVWKEVGPSLGSVREWAYGSGWWQEEGYRTPAYYGRFGEVLRNPLYSGMHSFADGVYSTLWGDGLCGGVIRMDYRPPWNYKLMCAGYWLALLPSLAVLGGAGLALWRFLRRPAIEWLVLLGIACSFALALVYMSLKVPGYGETRASFGLLTLIPFCAFGAMGFSWSAQRSKMLPLFLLSGLGIWAMISLATFWIRAQSVPVQLLKAKNALEEKDPLGAAELAKNALHRDPRNDLAKSLLADALARKGDTNKAFVLAREQAARNTNSPGAHLDLAGYFRARGQFEPAVAHTRRAIALAPDYYAAHLQLASLLLEMKRSSEALSECRELLRLKPWEKEARVLLEKAQLERR